MMELDERPAEAFEGPQRDLKPSRDRWGRGERVFMGLSQRTSRRGLLGRATRVLLVVTGVSASYHSFWVPRNAIAEPPATGSASPLAVDTTPCGNLCYFCGLCGRRCNHPDCGGTRLNCPAGYTQNKTWGYWTACCCCGACCLNIRYQDCAKAGSHSPCGAPRCEARNPCPPPGEAPEWVLGGYSYFCTTARAVSACGGSTCGDIDPE